MNRKYRRAAGKRGGSSSGSATTNGGSLFALAVRHHQSGQFAEAEQLYRQVLAADHDHFASLHHLGIIALQKGQPQAAIEPLGRAVAVDAHNPECHYNIAYAFQLLGRLNEAVGHYQQAVRLKPNYVEAHTNLGNMLMQAGRNAEAIAAYERVVDLKPTAEAYCNIANVLARIGRPDEAVAQFRRALALKPDLVAAHNNLANVLAGQGRHDEALVHVERALALAPNMVEAHANLGNVLLAQGKLSDAAHCYQLALEIKPDSPEANNNLGLVLTAQGDFAEAVRRLELAIGRRPDFIEAYNNLARALLAAGQVDPALGVLRRALAVRETPETQALVAQCLRGLRNPSDDDDVRDLMVRALSEPWGRANDLAPAAARLVKQTPAIAACIKRAVEVWPRRLAADDLFGPERIAAIARDPLLQCLLQTAVVADVELERLLTNARSALLRLALDASASSAIDEATLGFVCALARQCFINEQVFALTDDEFSLVRGLRDEAVAVIASGHAVPALRLAALASYVPLHSLPGIESILDQAWPPVLAAVLTQQVREPAEEQRLRAAIPALTPIEDDVSLRVRQQYEENPYPRWTRADLPQKPLRVDQYLRNKFPATTFRPLAKPDVDILIAGCGTGQHAIETTRRFAGARVLAIDLSLTSLAYAARKTHELAVPDLDYAQADILKLGSIDRTFDLIEASGVLHHMADPFAGWRVLLSLLRPGGLMAVALYSEIARGEIVKAREFIAEHGYGSTADEIRRCRQDLIAHEGGVTFRNICASSDFFSTSDCRDLLFHVQEHRLTLPHIAAFLAENNLDFIAFELDARIASQYRMACPDDQAMTDLASWDAFEREHPSTFSAMYQFWVQKRS